MNPPAPRHVLMTTDTIGGVWTFAIDLCSFLCARGTAVTVVTMGRLPDETQRARARAVRGLSLVETEYRLEWMEDCERDVVESGALVRELARKLRPELVHANTYYHATLPLDVPVLLSAHSCVTSWWRACKRTSVPPAYARYEEWVARAVRQADMLIAPTQSFLREFQSIHGSARAARAIWNGRARAPFRSGRKEPFVLAAGRLWDEAKNVGTLCRAAASGGPQLVLAGDDVSPDGAKADLGGAIILGRLCQGELADWMARAAVFAAPARYEPFGLTILEAALSGCALALADIPPLRELWDGAATFVDADDVEGWRSALATLIARPELAARAAERARLRAARYSIRRMGGAYLDAYRELVSTRVSGVAA